MGIGFHSHRVKPPSPPYQPQLRFLCAQRPGSPYALSTVTICSIRRASSALRCFSQPSSFSGICWLRVCCTKASHSSARSVQLLRQKALFRLLVAGVVRLHLQDHTGRFVAGCQ